MEESTMGVGVPMTEYRRVSCDWSIPTSVVMGTALLSTLMESGMGTLSRMVLVMVTGII